MNENKNIFGEPIESENNNVFGNPQPDFNTNQVPYEQPTEEQYVVPESTPIQVEEQPNIQEPIVEQIPNNQIPIEYNISQKEQNEIANQTQPQEPAQKDENENTAGGLIMMAILNALGIMAIIWLYLNKHKLIIFALPAFVIILSIICAIKDKKKSDHPQGILVGGILAAIISFGLSVVKVEQSDLFMYYTIVSVATGIIGTIISNSITTIISDFKNIKAMQTIGYILLFAGLIAAPIYIYKTYPEELHKYLFFEQIEVVAETEDEYILKTLKNRYGETFTCSDKVKNQIDQQQQKLTVRECNSATGIKTTVKSIEYESSKVQYIIVDDYLDQRYYNQYKEDLQEKLKTVTGANSIIIGLYSDINCNLIADCAECEEYFANKAALNERKNQYELSTKLNFQKDLTVSATDFINKGKYKYVITINGNYVGYQDAAYADMINKVLNSLNSNSIKNTFGYEITIKNASSLGDTGTYNTTAYKVKGTTNEELTFKDPVIVEE